LSDIGINEPKNRPIVKETVTHVNWSNELEKPFTSNIYQIKVNASLQMIGKVR
jgi:hypothetical protein